MTGSTNADMLTDATAQEGDWLIADRQTGGRGRLGRMWESPPDNLYASGLVRLRTGDPPAATLALVAAIAARDAVALWAPGVVIKWPNDLLLDGAKLAGILLERAGPAVVVGCGINLADHPAELDRSVTSLAAMGASPPEPMIVLETLTLFFSDWLTRWRADGLAVIRSAWLERAHPPGTALVARMPDGERIDGLFDGLTADCALRLRLADGQVRVIHAGDVFLI